MTEFVITQHVLGFKTEVSANYLRQDQLLQLLWADDLPDQATESRFYHHLCDDLPALDGLNHLLWQFAQRHLVKMHGRLVFDMDFTPLDTLSTKKESVLSPLSRKGYHPLVIYESRIGLLLDVELRNDQVYTSAHAQIYLAQLLDRCTHRSVILWGNSGFATPKINDLAETQHVYYVIKLKTNSLLKRLG
ncbi:MAG: transposase [Schleiferilactobacillus harbinensis]|jgi:hypothetical protein|nr:transposase [Schleiferilactobacillus harbinensis]MCI1912889.1 transposase [Schleiferilactobacillus harbinensis]